MDKTEDYDVLTEVDDPEVAFLNGSERLEFRLRPVPPVHSNPIRKRAPRPLQRRPSSCRSPTLWITLLCMLLSGLVAALTVIIYRRTFPEEIQAANGATSTSGPGVSYDTLPADEDYGSTQSPKGLTVKDATEDLDTSGDRTPSSLTSSPSLSSCDYQETRLPQHVRPTVYNLEIQTSLPHRNFSGTVRIELKIFQETTMVVLHAKDLTILFTTLTEDSSDGINLVSRMNTCQASSQLQLTSRKLLRPEAKYVLEISFQAPLRDDMHGFYSSEYVDNTGKNVTLATTQFEDTFARMAFPCFDEPAFKAVFRVKMVHDHDLLALFNTPVRTTEDIAGKPELMVTIYEDTPIMSTYLVAFVLCEFGKVTNRSESGVEINVYAVRHKVNQTGFALQIAVAALEYYEKFFSIPYPLQKLDLIAIPDFSAGAMENWGLITFREQSMLFDPKESSLSQMDLVSIVVAHEIAHQWFGNLVTMTWWDQLWLNEGFATFMQHLGADAAMPALASWSRMSHTIVQSALTSDALYSTHPIIADIKDASEVASRFDEISYSKGASVLLMLYESLSPSIFQQGVTNYLYKNKYGNAKTEDLWSSLDNAWHNSTLTQTKDQTEITIKNIADKWTLQPGFPLVTATLEPDGKSISVSQRRISPSEAFAIRPDASLESWIVPLNYLTATSPKNATSVWLDQPAKTVVIGNVEQKWYKLNARQTGFYRVNYDEGNWVELIKALKEDPEVMSAEDRANLLDDAFSLARIGRVNLTTAFSLASYLTKERHFLPWSTITSYFDGAESILFETEVFLKFRKWRQDLIQPVFAALDCSAVPSDNIPLRRQCVHIFGEACHADLPACIESSRRMFSKGDIPVDLRSVVYRTVVKHGSEVEWNNLWEKYRSTQIASEKTIILGALSTTQNILLVERFLKYASDPTVIRPMESTHVLLGLSMNFVARDAVWRTIRELWDNTLYVKYGDDPVISGIFYCLHWMTSKRDLDEVKEFFYKPGRKLGSGTLALSQAIETIELRRKFLDNSLKTLGDILANC